MVKENLMLILLISRPKQLGNDIDVYLEPLVKNLKELWNISVRVCDAFSKSMFNLKAILMWTVNDFLVYGNLSGYATKGKVTSSICGIYTCSQWLKCSKKFAYLGHKMFITSTNPFLMKISWFDGHRKTQGKPKPLSDVEVLHAITDIENGGKEEEEKCRF